MTVKITSPIEGYTGRSTFGPFNTTFDKGVAVLPEINEGLRAYLVSRGYTVEGDVAETDAIPTFDPGKHTADEVLDYLGVSEGHDPVTVDEFERVLAAEQAGKARKGLLEALSKAQTEENPNPTPNDAQTGADGSGEGTEQGGGDEK